MQGDDDGVDVAQARTPMSHLNKSAQALCSRTPGRSTIWFPQSGRRDTMRRLKAADGLEEIPDFVIIIFRIVLINRRT